MRAPARALSFRGLWSLEVCGAWRGKGEKEGVGTAGAQAQGPNWEVGYRVHAAKGRFRVPLLQVLCPLGSGCVRAGDVEVAKWGARLSTC